MTDDKRPRKSISLAERWIYGLLPKLSPFEERVAKYNRERERLKRVLQEQGEDATGLNQPGPSGNTGNLLSPNLSDEERAAEALASQLRDQQSLTRAGATEWLQAAGFKIGKRSFQNRVWPKARMIAGLDAKAPPGRKRRPTTKKSSR
jgi:hypothetical protein